MEVIQCKLAKLNNRVADLLNVAVDTNDGLPQCISRRCKPRLKTLESAVEDLEAIYSKGSHLTDSIHKHIHLIVHSFNGGLPLPLQLKAKDNRGTQENSNCAIEL